MGTRVIERLGGEEKLAEGYLSVETGGSGRNGRHGSLVSDECARGASKV
jgi:hypothetical protein